MSAFWKAAAIAAICVVATDSAEAVDYRTELSKKVNQSQQVTALGDNLAGDQVSPFTGSLEFTVTDVSLPGNFSLPVALGRRYIVEPSRNYANSSPFVSAPVARLFGDWDLDIPYLSGIFSATYGWEGGSPSTARCSSPIGPRDDVLHPGEFWSGDILHVPGQEDQTMLFSIASNTNRPQAGGPFYWNTNKNWWFSCLSSTKNNAGGEGFEAHAPDGTNYYFDWLSSRPASMVTKEQLNGQTAKQLRKEILFLPSRIEDRFGNWVQFTYSSDSFARLLTITSSDQRTITLTYSGSRVDTVSDGTRTWHYNYTGGNLTSVTLPDNSAWQYSLASIAPDLVYDDSCDPTGQPPDFCYGYPIMSLASPATGYIVHPSGARVDFTLDVHLQAGQALGSPGGWSYPLSLTQKQLSGAGLTTATWSYAQISDAPDPNGSCTYCPTRIWSDVLNPDGSISRQLFDLDGKPLQQLRGSVVANSSSPPIPHSLRGNDIDIADDVSPLTGTVPVFYDETDITYTTSPTQVGIVPGGYSVSPKQSAFLTPEVTRVQHLQGASFTRQVNAEDPAFRMPTSVTSSSQGLNGPAGLTGYSRTIVTEYFHDTTRWIIGQVQKTTCKNTTDCPGVNGKEISKTEFDANSLPWKTYSYGILQQTLTYDTATAGALGTLSSVKDGRDYKTTLTSWKRGTPQVITFPTSPSVTQTAQVNNVGNLDWVENELGSRTCYGYDALGRLSSITQPSEAASHLCNTTTWAATTRNFVQVPTLELGIAGGHWKQTVQTGNGLATTYYDARWQPVISLTEDVTNSASKSYTVSRYDTMGRKTFSSYAVAALSGVDDPVTGVRTSFDALGRTSQVQQDNGATPNSAVLNTVTAYLTGFKVQVTNPRNFSTTTSFQAFDSSTTEAPVLIQLPEGVTTTISRQPALGKTLAISRSGTYSGSQLSETRQYVYDENDRLCKTINPESGATLVQYDLAGNVSWTVDSKTLTSAVCDRDSAPILERTAFTYDQLNREILREVPGGAANITTSYLPNGSVGTLSAANTSGGDVLTTYEYNRRGLLSKETQVNGQTGYPVTYAYDSNGHRTAIVYPDGEEVDYTMDALGRTTDVASAGGQVYASGVTYWPNGGMKTFKYGPASGTGPTHETTQDYRKLPLLSRDYKGTTKIVYDTYTYDASGNVVAIADGTTGSPNSRTMTYDGLDRLTSANGSWGAGAYSYDPMNNLRSADQGARQFRYTYDANWRLDKIKSPSGTQLYAFAHDDWGNVTAKNSQQFVFDVANRMSSANLSSGAGSQSYRYDGLGRRVQVTDPDGSLNYWIYAMEGQVLYGLDDRRDQTIAYIYLNGSQIATRARMVNSPNTVTIKFQMTDALGSLVANTSTSGGSIARTMYTPWGEAPAVDGAGYNGHIMDQGTGLTYMQQRYYDPLVGTFMSVDPVPTRSNSGAIFNRYEYAASNPFGFRDPDGRVPIWALDRGPQNEGVSSDFTSSVSYEEGVDDPTAGMIKGVGDQVRKMDTKLLGRIRMLFVRMFERIPDARPRVRSAFSAGYHLYVGSSIPTDVGNGGNGWWFGKESDNKVYTIFLNLDYTLEYTRGGQTYRNPLYMDLWHETLHFLQFVDRGGRLLSNSRATEEDRVMAGERAADQALGLPGRARHNDGTWVRSNETDW